MFLKNIKRIFKLKFPLFSNKLISIRDNNKFFRFLNEGKNLDINKNVHGKEIVKIEENQKNNEIFLSYSFRPRLEKDTFKNIKFQKNSENTASYNSSVNLYLSVPSKVTRTPEGSFDISALSFFSCAILSSSNFIFLTNSSPSPNIIFKTKKDEIIIKIRTNKPPVCFTNSGNSLILFK